MQQFETKMHLVAGLFLDLLGTLSAAKGSGRRAREEE